MADNNFASADKKISISGGQPEHKFNPAALLDGMSKDVRKRWMIVGVVSAVSISVVGGWMSSANQAPTPARVTNDAQIDTTPKGLSSQKDWKAQTGAELQSLKQSLTESGIAQKEMLARMEALRQEVALAKTAPAPLGAAGPAAGRMDFNLPPPPEPPRSITPTPSPSQAVMVAPGAPGAPADVDSQSIPAAKRSAARSFIPSGVEADAKEAEEKEKARVQDEMVPNDRMGYLPAGSFAAATMISGVEAFTGGTAQAQPQPIVIRLDENAVLPNAARYQVKGCHVLASVWGDMSSERVFGRLATLTCVDANNKLVLSEEVEGNLIDSDGKNGIRGALQDRQGAKLGRSLLAGFAQGMSAAFGAAQSTVTSGAFGATSTISGSSMAAAGYSGANSAAQSLAQYYLKQAEATMPVIAVDAGRHVSVLFTKSKALRFETTSSYKVRPANNVKVDREAN